MDAGDIARADQAAKALVDFLPGFLWSLYRAFVDQGFSDLQAMTLVETYMREFARKGPSDA